MKFHDSDLNKIKGVKKLTHQNLIEYIKYVLYRIFKQTRYLMIYD